MILTDKPPPSNPLDGFFCCLCWDRFPWSALGAFDRRLRWCDACADWYERLCNPPVFSECVP